MSSGGSRVSFPPGVQKMIQNIREVTNKHSEEDIYAVLKECSMDPNETIQKLLYLDTFHEVKKKHDRKKEIGNSRSFEDSRPVNATQRRGARSAQGNNISKDANGGRYMTPRNENRVNHNIGRGSLPVSQKPRNKGIPIVSKSPDVPVNGPTNESPDSKQYPSSTDTPTTTYVSCLKGDQKRATLLSNHHAVAAASSDTVSVPCNKPHLPIAPVVRDVVSQQVATESTKASIGKEHDEKQINIPDYDIQLSQQEIDPSKVVTNESANITVEGDLSEISVSILEEEPTKNVHVSGARHVIFPTHFHVPEEFKSGLTFGSFDVKLGPTSKFINEDADEKASGPPAADVVQENDEIAMEASLSNQSESSTAAEEEVDYPDHPQSPEDVAENIATPLSESGDDSSTAAQKFDHSQEQETLLPSGVGGGPQFPVQNIHNYGFGYMPAPMVGTQPVPFDLFELQARAPNFSNGNSVVQSASGLTEPTGTAPSSVPMMSPQQVALYRQAYPLNYLPYSHHYSPYFLPPMHHFLTHGGFLPQQQPPSTYLSPTGASAPAAAGSAGFKYALPPYKPVGVPSGYGSFTSSPGAYGLTAAVTSGGGDAEPPASHLKENNAYTTTGQQNEGSTVWMPAQAGRDMHVAANSFYNFASVPAHGQHVAFSPAQTAGHSIFPGLYHQGAAQTMMSPSSVHHQLMQQQQQSQNFTEPAAQQHAAQGGSNSGGNGGGTHMNWNGTY